MSEYIIRPPEKVGSSLDLQPIIVGEIVRCRDCKHMHTVRDWAGYDVDECWLHADPESGALGKEWTEPDGFCAWGIRKAVEQ